MNFNNYTTKSQETIQLAQQLAQGFGHNQIENEHIFKALTQVDENVLPFLFKKLNINIDVVNQILNKQLESLPKVSGAELMISREAGKTLNEASIIAKKMKDDFDVIVHKFKKGRVEDGVFDSILFAVMASLFAGSYGGMVVAMIASLIISIYLWASPPMFFSGEKGFLKTFIRKAKKKR